jgi:F0F1-type ATP synthase membrane subunit c/vacuolar-type H+-ATPase subunit K
MAVNTQTITTMAPQQPSPPGPSTPALFRQRLANVTIILITAQVFYGLVAICLAHGGFRAPKRNEPGGMLLLGIFVAGLIASMVSLPIVQSFAKRQPTVCEFPTLSRALLCQFWIGFVFAEIAAIAGLVIFFLYDDLKTLFFLLWVAGTAIAAHFLRVKKLADEFERG